MGTMTSFVVGGIIGILIVVLVVLLIMLVIWMLDRRTSTPDDDRRMIR